MKNQIYRLPLTFSSNKELPLEFYIAEMNEVNPVRDTLCLAVQIVDGDSQMDAVLDQEELESLIDYLEKCERAIRDFNKHSKPIDTTLNEGK